MTSPHPNLLFFIIILIFMYLFIYLFILLFRAAPQHMEVPRLGIELKLQPLASTTATALWDLSLTVTYTTAHGNAGSLTH